MIKKTPDGGLHIVLLLHDTASDECLMAKMVVSQCTWISDAPCCTHVTHLYLKDAGDVDEVRSSAGRSRSRWRSTTALSDDVAAVQVRRQTCHREM